LDLIPIIRVGRLSAVDLRQGCQKFRGILSQEPLLIPKQLFQQVLGKHLPTVRKPGH
jgi:hypothetical protein